jgi:thiol-disulfide isomerase/thioredoxin
MTNFKFIVLIIIIGLMSSFAGLYFSKNISLSLNNPQTEIFFNSISKDKNNKSVSLSQFKNRWLLVNFWATWCAPCREEIPELNELFKNNKDVHLIAIAIDEIGAVNKFLTKTPINYESLISNDIKGVEISKSLGNDRGVLPFTVLIKPNGKIQEVFFGKLNMESLNKHLKDTIK